jgi:ABC-2 type transport system permease protein
VKIVQANKTSPVKGWWNVLKFTYIQTIKAKSFIASSVIMIVIFSLMLAGANFLPGILSSEPEIREIRDEDGNVVAEHEAFKIEEVTVLNASDLDLDFSFLETFGVKYRDALTYSVDFDMIMDGITNSEEARVFAVIEETEHGYEVKMSRPESTELINNSDCFALLSLFHSVIHDANLVSLGIAEDDIHKANSWINTSVNVGGEEPKSEIAMALATGITMLTSVLLAVLIISYGQLTAQAIATEKASRVMELLLTSVKPLAVIIGKVLATMLVAVTSIVAVGGVTTGIFFMTAPFGMLGEVTGMVEATDPAMANVAVELSAALSGFSPLNIVLIALIFILGFLFYSLISGLIGASVSKIEDLQTALQPLIYISLLGFYLAYIPPIFGLDMDDGRSFITTIAYYLPISSPFALPGGILTGDITGAEVAIAIGVLALCLVLFAVFVAKVYEHIILNNGDRVKIKDMIKMAKKS